MSVLFVLWRVVIDSNIVLPSTVKTVSIAFCTASSFLHTNSITQRSSCMLAPMMPAVFIAFSTSSLVASVLFRSTKKELASVVFGIRPLGIFFKCFNLHTAKVKKSFFSSTPRTALAYDLGFLRFLAAEAAIRTKITEFYNKTKDFLYSEGDCKVAQ